ncbi:hypothetical protein ACFW16_32550 [Inquilinus sp. NPDC058860]|uniref:hypothetical protein n=1 Tax=Inquilinus sp. NPDC058860 TaxID=3346652 RepID=UPI0036B537F8
MMPKEGCFGAFYATSRAYLIHAQGLALLRRSVGGLNATQQATTNSVFNAFDLVIESSTCSVGIWNDFKQCAVTAMQSTDITTTAGYEMVARDCYDRFSSVYGQ